MVGRGNRKAFSLIEMVVAAVLLSGAVVTLCAIGNRSLEGVRLNRQHELGWEVLDRQLTLIDYIGIDEFIELGQFDGEFGDEETTAVVYHWSSDMTELEADNLWQVNMVVSWSGGGGGGRVSASTVFNGTDSLEASSEGEGTPEEPVEKEEGNER